MIGTVLGLAALAAISLESAAASPDPDASLPNRKQWLDQAFCAQQRAREAELAGAASPVKRALAETLREPELQTCEIQDRWRWWDDDQPREPSRSRSPHETGQWFAAVIEAGLWFGLGVFIAMAGWWLWRQPRRASGPRRRRATAKFSPIPGWIDLTAPPDAGLGAAAWRLWNAGQPREALRVLYQGSLASLTARHGLPVAASATEDECLRLAVAQLRDPDLLKFLRRLTCVWQATAYAHRPPTAADVQRLCEEWPRYFTAADRAPP